MHAKIVVALSLFGVRGLDAALSSVQAQRGECEACAPSVDKAKSSPSHSISPRREQIFAMIETHTPGLRIKIDSRANR